MSLVNPEWLQYDTHARNLVAKGKFTRCENTIDNNIMAVCAERGVVIPLDLQNHIDSPIIRSIAVDYAMYILFSGNWGARDTDNEVYQNKAQYHWSQYDRAVKNLCPTLV